MFESYYELQQVKEAAEILAETTDWPHLYDPVQLRNNEVPIYAVTYMDDMYVHFDLVSDTAAMVKGVQQSITNTMYHDALRSRSTEVIRQLLQLRDDSID